MKSRKSMYFAILWLPVDSNQRYILEFSHQLMEIHFHAKETSSKILTPVQSFLSDTHAFHSRMQCKDKMKTIERKTPTGLYFCAH